jgi:Fe-S cluster assembly ATPase SufC
LPFECNLQRYNSGLDVDALRDVAAAVNTLKEGDKVGLCTLESS